MKEPLSPKTKVFFINFAQFIIIFLGFCLLFSIDPTDEGPVHFNFLQGYLGASFFAVIYLGIKIGLRFTRGIEIDEYIKKNNLTREEFYKKYGDLLDILL